MQIVIAGAGTIGRHIAELLQQQEQHDVAMIELDRDHLRDVEDMLDIQTLPGNANNPEILRQAGVETADLYLGMTQSDETNLLSSMAAATLGARKTVARVRQAFYQRSVSVPYPRLLGIDRLISPEWLTALEFVKHINQPGAIAIESFAGGRLQLRQVRMASGHPIEGRSLMDAPLPDDILIAMIARGDELEIPRGDSRLLDGDRITVLGRPDDVERFSRTFAVERSDEPIKRVFVCGGGTTGSLVARMLGDQGYSVTLLEHDRDRCETLSHRLDRTRIVCGDGTNLGVLKEERVAHADLFIAAMGDDENNLMSCLQARSLNVAHLHTVMKRPDYAQLLEQLGIDLAISPRHIVGSRVLAMIKRGEVRSVYLIEDGRAEVVEFVAQAEAPALGVPLKDLKLPRGCLIASVLKGGRRVIVPRGQTCVEVGDTVVTMSLAKHFEGLERLFGLGATP